MPLIDEETPEGGSVGELGRLLPEDANGTDNLVGGLRQKHGVVDVGKACRNELWIDRHVIVDGGRSGVSQVHPTHHTQMHLQPPRFH